MPKATTFTTLKGLATDQSMDAPGGDVVHPTKAVALSATPGGKAVAALPPIQIGKASETWVPVIDKKAGGWLEVLLPNRPNKSAGWICGSDLKTRHTPYVIKVDIAARKLTLDKSGSPVGSWTVAVGAKKTPTTPGRTFTLALLSGYSYSPYVIPLGAHSDSLKNFAGGPGTEALHTWKDASVFGKAISNGCVRVPQDALAKLTKVPTGTAVLLS